ncbi:hypothetical protein E0H51_34080 [Rhizobium leguminosarum bv. viciae]|uniref:hypothetical protein n=1 Tax=Rhizobium leguminosarum TaxID=384 RepID=UPI001039C7BC|nr:hypothetical protein [Rhizobium leguminosarum]TBY66241.1 hypothetical protein E0H51_34080 [Rhizobium leguminosarum bv. viciae]
MFWKKRQEQDVEAPEPVMEAEPIEPAPQSTQAELEKAAKELAASLRAYADASYAAKKAVPDEELTAAHCKVEIARKIATEGRIAYALGRCLPEQMAQWHAWSQRDDFMDWVGFAATNITSSRTAEEVGAGRVVVTTNDFTYRGRHYRLVFRDSGLSSAPDDHVYIGEVHFYAGDNRVAKFDVTKDLMKEYSEWQFADLTGFRIGTWMQEVLEMSVEIEASQEKKMNRFSDERARQAADEIDLG